MAGRSKNKLLYSVEDISDDLKIFSFKKLFFKSLEYPKILNLIDWGEKHFYLPSETSAEPGKWRLERFPFIKKIALALSVNSSAREIVVEKAAQLGLTTLTIMWLFYIADVFPSPTIYTQKSDDDIKDFVKQKLKTHIAVCRRLDYILGDKKPRHLSRAYNDHGYPGGYLACGGANETGFIRSKSTRYAGIDEEDTFKCDVSGEGSPVALIKKRQVTFPDSKLFRISTPTLEETSTIEPAYFYGSQEQYYIPCPHCNNIFVIDWEMIKYSKKLDIDNLPVEYFLECPFCGDKIVENEHKTWMLDNGEWMSTKNIEDSEKPLPPYIVSNEIANPSFQISAFYSPIGHFSWRDAIKEWFEYLEKRDIGLLKVIVNQTWGKTFKLLQDSRTKTILYNRREAYKAEVPNEALVLTAGCDIQDDRIELEVVGWGQFEENWSIDYVVLYGDTSIKGDNEGLLPDRTPTVWRLLDDYLQRTYRHESGADIPIEKVLIDSGYKTEEVNIFCAPRERRRIYPVQGKAGWSKGFFSCQARRHERYGTIQYRAHTDECKNKIYAMLNLDSPGNGYCHFPVSNVYTEKYFYGLTCEFREVKLVRGKRTIAWTNPSGARNEPIDCRVYAYCAFLSYPINLAQRAKDGFLTTKKVRVTRFRGNSGL